MPETDVRFGSGADITIDMGIAQFGHRFGLRMEEGERP